MQNGRNINCDNRMLVEYKIVFYRYFSKLTTCFYWTISKINLIILPIVYKIIVDA